MKTIEEYTNYLLNCRFTDDSFDPEGHEEHLQASWELFENYSWEEIAPAWMEHLYMNCKTPEEVINFVNLFIYYEAADRPINDPIKFIGYLYYKVDMDKYWNEAGELFEGVAITILSKSGLVNTMADPYYNPMKDSRIIKEVDELREVASRSQS